MNIVKNRKIFFAISAILIVLGLGFGLSTGLNYGIDFTGGSLMQIDLGNNIPDEEVRKIIDEFDTKAVIIHAGSDKEEVIIKSTLDLSNEERTEVFNKFKEEYNLEDEAFTQSERLGPAIGSEIQKKAILSLIVAMIAMLIYITFRFEAKFGLAAIIALAHDVLIILAVYALFNLPLDSSFVAAILTIVGYSINDTIVIFDRIRENLKVMKKDKLEDIINTSIAQTLTRSINTSFTTLLAITTLYIFGVEAIRDFAFPLIVGILSGTYSSIFIASPVWFILKTKYKDKNKLNINRV